MPRSSGQLLNFSAKLPSLIKIIVIDENWRKIIFPPKFNIANICVIFVFFSQVVEDGYEFFAKRQLVTLFSAPNYCGEFDNAGGMMSVDESLMCSFQVS